MKDQELILILILILIVVFMMSRKELLPKWMKKAAKGIKKGIKKAGKAVKKVAKKARICSKPCKKGYKKTLKVGCMHTCVKPCKKGFKRRSNAAGSAFCDKKRPRYTRIGKEKTASGCKKGYEFNKPDKKQIAIMAATTGGVGALATSLPLCYKKCKKNFYGIGPVCYPCTGLEAGKKVKAKCLRDARGESTRKK